MKPVSVFVSSVLKSLNPRLSEWENLEDGDDIPDSKRINHYDLNFSNNPVSKGDQFYNITYPFELKIFYSCKGRTKNLYYEIGEQAKKLIAKLEDPMSLDDSCVTQCQVDDFQVTQDEKNKRILTLIINANASTLEALRS